MLVTDVQDAKAGGVKGDHKGNSILVWREGEQEQNYRT